jgi:hypothetical protein
VLRGKFVSHEEEVTGRYKKVTNEELHNFYCSSDIIRIIKSRRLSRMRHVACIFK